MILRSIPLLACACLVAACDSGGSARPSSAADGVRYDTVAGLRLGMLLPEARAAAAARGTELRCQAATTEFPRGSVDDTLWRKMQDVDYCRSPDEQIVLSFKRGTLIAVTVEYSDDWARVPLDTVISRLSDHAGPPTKREARPYGDRRRELLVSWSRDDDPAVMSLRCFEGAPSDECRRDHFLSR